MAMIGVIALVVIGPERLPGVARTAGQWIGSARRFMSSVQADINLEVGKTDELKRLLEEQTNIQSMHEIIEQTPSENNDRKPVPASKKLPDDKPEYVLKAMNDDPVVDDSTTDSSASTDESSSETSSSTLNNKHD